MFAQPKQSLFVQMHSLGRNARLYLLAVTLDGIVYSAWALFFNFYILERGFSREFLGMVTAAMSVSALLFGLPLGMLSDRIGRRNGMLLGMGLYLVCAGIEILAPQPGMILLMSFLSGIGSMLYMLSQAPFMMKASTPQNRTLLFSLSFGLVTLAGAVGNLFAGQLPDLMESWLGEPASSATAYQMVLLASILVGSLTMVSLALIREPRQAAQPELPAETTPARQPIGRILTRPLTIKLCLPGLCIGLGAALLIPYMNVYFHERFQVSDQMLGVLFSLMALLTGVGSLYAPRLAEGLGGKIRASVVTQGLSVAFLAVVGFSPLAWPAVIGFLMRGALMNMAVPLMDNFAMEQVDEQEQATLNSLRTLIWQIGWIIGPYLSGVVQSRYGFSPLFVATTILYALATVMTWVFFQDRDEGVKVSPAIALETP